MPHPLLKLARRVVFRAQPPMPPQATYNLTEGVWKLSSVLLARSPEFELVSKKKDIETGEDNKGQ